MMIEIDGFLSDEKYKAFIRKSTPELKEKRISGERIRHMHGVAELMYKYHDAFHCENLSKEDVYILGLNHEVGIMNLEDDCEEMSLVREPGSNSGRLLAHFCGFDEYGLVVRCLLHHGKTPGQYSCRYRCPVDEIPNEMILLWWADMNVEAYGEHAGEIVGFEKRLEGIKQRYGEGGNTHVHSAGIIFALVKMMERRQIRIETEPVL